MAQSDAQRRRTYRARHPKKVRAEGAAYRESGRPATLKKQRDPNVEREQRQQRYFRFGKPKHGGPSISALELVHPNYTYIDRHGNIHLERWQTPEQLEAQLRREGRL
jgi:hypothetical protein